MTEQRKCRCGEPLETPATGRPPKFCSTVCRRGWEYQLRREQALVLVAEKKLQLVRAARAVWDSTGKQAEEAFWVEEVQRRTDWLEQSLCFDEDGSW